ncbi:hypothetical protein [Nitrogeniibacter aestuarii]|uniref:hypothetical protein n=1 Tax=Nitrogeniibacter aestuarii TaxID=2815343 RepID=UPI001D102E03|nr:hypothetical protein [Nitrogeniibacter aestuarii]
MELRIGADDLDAKDLTLVRSTSRLHTRAWVWVDSFFDADLWLVDLTRPQDKTPADMLADARVACLDNSLEHASAGLKIVTKPLKAAHLMRLFDSVMNRTGGADAVAEARIITPAPQPAAPADARIVDVPGEAAAPAADTPPWFGRKVRLLKSPNLAKYPVSVELLGWLETMQAKPVDVQIIHDTLPLDRDMLQDLLNEAAKGGALVDEAGQRIAPMVSTKKSRFKIW